MYNQGRVLAVVDIATLGTYEISVDFQVIESFSSSGSLSDVYERIVIRDKPTSIPMAVLMVVLSGILLLGGIVVSLVLDC